MASKVQGKLLDILFVCMCLSDVLFQESPGIIDWINKASYSSIFAMTLAA